MYEASTKHKITFEQNSFDINGCITTKAKHHYDSMLDAQC